MQRKNKEIKQIFFDLDGTLLDTAPQFYLALSNVIERTQQEQVSFDAVSYTHLTLPTNREV